MKSASCIVIAAAQAAFLVASSAWAESPGWAAAQSSAKCAAPCLSVVVAQMEADLQRDGWWQVNPNGLSPNDQTYPQFLRQALRSLFAHVSPHQMSRLIQQLEAGQ